MDRLKKIKKKKTRIVSELASNGTCVCQWGFQSFTKNKNNLRVSEIWMKGKTARENRGNHLQKKGIFH
jgi:hypothetical protein